MKRNLLTLIICLTGFCLSLEAQKIPRKLISVAGAMQQEGGYYLSWSVGEPVIHTTSRLGYTLTQGFQQPSLINKLFLPAPLRDEVRAFPNPVRDQLQVEFDVKYIYSYRIEVISIEGRVLTVKDIFFDQSTNSTETELLDFSTFSQGIYLVRVSSNDKRIAKLFKIEKINTRR